MGSVNHVFIYCIIIDSTGNGNNNVDDSAYDKQLNGYRRFIEKKTGKKTRCFLYSILDEVYREVLND